MTHYFSLYSQPVSSLPKEKIVLKEIIAMYIIHRTTVVTLSLVKITFKKYGGSNKKAGQTA